MLTHSNQESKIVLRDVSKRFGDVVAVNQVSLEVEAGEFVCLLGPSGCGKTTTLRILAGFEYPDEGEVWISGERIDRTPPHRRSVNMVFQQYALFPHLSVFENIAFGLRRKGVGKADIKRRVGQMLEVTQLSGLETRYPSQLSGGQQQRVALARALVNEPRGLLLDEPLAALDLKLRKRMQIELKELQRRLGISFVYVTHDQEEALLLADKIGVMDQGRMVQFGRGENIYNRPGSRFVAEFVGESNLIPFEAGVLENDESELSVVCKVGMVKVSNDSVSAISGTTGVRYLCIRPEALIVDRLPPKVANVFSGRVVRRMYLGAVTMFHVCLEPSRVTVVVTIASANRIAEVGEGDQVFVGWDEKSASVVSEGVGVKGL